MTRQSTLPSIREQAHHALLLLGVPTPARLLVDVHAALLDGDLSVPALVALLRDEERAFVAGPPAGPDGSATALTGDSAGGQGGTAGRPYPYVICPGLNGRSDRGPRHSHGLDLGLGRSDRYARGRAGRGARRDRAHRGAGGDAARSVRDLAVAAAWPRTCPAARKRSTCSIRPRSRTWRRTALEDPALAAAVAAEQPIRDAAVLRAAELDERQRLFGVPAVPHQRGGA